MMHFLVKPILLVPCLFILGTIQSAAQSKKYAIAPGLSAEIAHTQGSKALSVKLSGVETIELDLTQPADGVFQIKSADYNFDGFKDFAFTEVANPGAIHPYDIYLYHPLEKTFELLERPDGACEFLGNVRINKQDKTLRSSCRSGTKTSMDIFSWADSYSLNLMKSVDHGDEAQAIEAEVKAAQKEEKAEERKEKRKSRKAQQEADETDE